MSFQWRSVTAADRRESGYAAPVATYLSVIGDRVALAGVLKNAKMAFPTTRRSEVESPEKDDELFLVSTRGCFRNPTRDRTRVLGRAVLRAPVSMAPEPIELIGRTFNRTCSLEITGTDAGAQRGRVGTTGRAPP